MNDIKIILASKSPRRKEMLEQAGIACTVIPSDIEENVPCDKPENMVMELARQKAAVVAGKFYDIPVVGADTMVFIDGITLNKPKDRDDAIAMITMLQGREHHVYSGVAIVFQGREYCFYGMCKVRVAEMTKDEIEAYIDFGESYDKAGSYGIQSRFGKFIESTEGDFSAVIGLPIAALYKKLKAIL
jgi:septum formation protein